MAKHEVEDALRIALEDVMRLVRKHGLGDEDRETEPVVARAERALALADKALWKRPDMRAAAAYACKNQ